MLVELAEKRDDQLLEKYSEVLFRGSSFTMNFDGRIANLNEPPGAISGIVHLLSNAFSAEWQRIRISFFGLPPIVYESPSDTVSSNVRRRSSLPIPPCFLEIFSQLPVDILENILPNLDRRSVLNLRLTCYNFHMSIREVYYDNLIITIQHCNIFITPNGNIRVLHNNTNYNFTHAVFLRNIRQRRFNVLVVNHQGDLRAADCHIPQLHVQRLELRFRDAIPASQVSELETLFHEVVENPEITSIVMIARTHGDNRAVQASLDAILAACPRIIQAITSILVLRA